MAPLFSAKVAAIDAGSNVAVGKAKQWVALGLKQWENLRMLVGTEEIRKRLQTEYTTFGVVSSLLLSVACTIFMTPPEQVLQGRTKDVFAVLCGACIGFNLATIIMSSFLMIQVNLMSDQQLGWFVSEFEFFMGANFTLFIVAMMCLFATLMIVSIKLYSTAGIASSALIGGVSVLCGVLLMWLDAKRKIYQAAEQEELDKQRLAEKDASSARAGATDASSGSEDYHTHMPGAASSPGKINSKQATATVRAGAGMLGT